MLSSVSYVCLGVCAGMWVISIGMYLSVLVLSFISVLLFQRSGYFICLWLFRVCVCSFCFYFADVFSSTVRSDLRATVPQGSSALQSLASSLPDVVSTSASSKYFSSYNRWKSWAREHGLTVLPAPPFYFAILPRYLMTVAKTTSPQWCQQFTALPGFTSSVASRLLLIISWWRVLLPVRSVSWPIKQPRRSLSQSLG